MYVREMNCEDVNWIGLTPVRKQWGTFMILTFEFSPYDNQLCQEDCESYRNIVGRLNIVLNWVIICQQ